jgi:hypothetical protein
VTFRVLVCCDGLPKDRPFMALENCRAFLPLTVRPIPEMVQAVNTAGWKVREEDGAHLCPACVRAILST